MERSRAERQRRRENQLKFVQRRTVTASEPPARRSWRALRVEALHPRPSQLLPAVALLFIKRSLRGQGVDELGVQSL